MTNGKTFGSREAQPGLLLSVNQAAVVRGMVAEQLARRLSRAANELEAIDGELSSLIPAEVRVMVEAAVTSLGKAIDFVDPNQIPF